MQMMIDLAYQKTRVYWFNFEMERYQVKTRLKTAWPGTEEQLEEASANLLEFQLPEQVQSIKAIAKHHHEEFPHQRALFVIDTFQRLPVQSKFALSDYNQWLNTFDQIKLQYGYPFIIASQKQRGLYEDPVLWAFKETSRMEDTMSVGIQIVPIQGIQGAVELHIVKNRDKPYTGHCLNLFREYEWWFQEEAVI